MPPEYVFSCSYVYMCSVQAVRLTHTEARAMPTCPRRDILSLLDWTGRQLRRNRRVVVLLAMWLCTRESVCGFVVDSPAKMASPSCWLTRKPIGTSRFCRRAWLPENGQLN